MFITGERLARKSCYNEKIRIFPLSKEFFNDDKKRKTNEN